MTHLAFKLGLAAPGKLATGCLPDAHKWRALMLRRCWRRQPNCDGRPHRLLCCAATAN